MQHRNLLLGAFVLFTIPSFCQLTGILPNTGQLGQSNLQTMITGNNIFYTTSTPSGNLSNVLLSKPGYSIWDQTAYQLYVNNNTALTRFNIPTPAGYAGTYSTTVYTWTGSYSLPSSFTVTLPSNYISGKVYHDVNQNGILDAGETGIQNQHIKLNPGNVSVYTDNNGDYLIPTTIAVYNIQWITAGNLILTSDSASYTQLVNGAITGRDFGIASSYADYSTFVIFNSGLPRCSTDVGYNLSYRNLGNIAYNATAYIVKDPATTFVSSNPLPVTVNGDTVFFVVSNVPPFGNFNTISATFHLPNPGDTILMKSNFTALDAVGGVGYTQNNQLSQVVVCSFDPNDKSVTPPGEYAQHYTLFGDTLEYLIRFQNTGTASALKVVVRDILDPSLDLSTFQIVGSSHNMITSLTPDRQVTFTFNNINLPDSNTNEPGSHGWITYRIKPNFGISSGTIISNTAYIYFDFNSPVITNTTFNTMVPVIPAAVPEYDANQHGVLVVPNPMNDVGHLFFKNSDAELLFLEVLDLKGRVINRDLTNTGHFEISRKDMIPGIYMYRISAGKQIIWRGKLAVN